MNTFSYIYLIVLWIIAITITAVMLKRKWPK